MKKRLLIFCSVVALSGCGSAPTAPAQGATKSDQKQYVEVLYFHGRQRCVTCNAIEQLTKEVIENDFLNELKEGKVTFRVVDLATAEGEQIADRYEVSWSSLYINQWSDGQEATNNLTDLGFSYAQNSPDVFKSGVKKRITELLQ